MSDKEVEFASLVSRGSQKSAEPETKQFPALLSIKSVDEKSRRITAIASTGNLDRDNEIIEPEAFRESLPLFMKNPVVLAAHQHRLSDGSSPIVANIVAAKITSAGLEVTMEFHDITELANEYWELYRQKKQRSLSVGFMPVEGSWEMRNGKSVFVHKKVELLEISLVAVGSNRDALTRAKQRKLDFINDKKQQRAEQKEFEKLLDEIRVENPDFDAECEEFAEMISGFDSEDGARKDFFAAEESLDDIDLVGLVKGL